MERPKIQPTAPYGQCKCCLKDTYLKNMWEPHENKGEWEVYGQMIVDCFGIDWTILTVEDDNICQVCISKLRVAVDFKKQVQESQAKTLEGVEAVAEEEEIVSSDKVQTETIPVLENQDSSASTTLIKEDTTGIPLKEHETTTPLKKENKSIPLKKENTSIPLKKENTTTTPIKKEYTTTTPLKKENTATSLFKIEKITTTSVKKESTATTCLKRENSMPSLKKELVTTPLKKELVTIPLKKELVTTPLKIELVTTALKKELVTTSLKKENSTSSETVTSAKPFKEERRVFHTVDVESCNDSSDDNDSIEFVNANGESKTFEDVVFLEEDVFEEYEDDDNEFEPETKRRKVSSLLTKGKGKGVYKKYAEEDMKKAVEAVKSNQMSRREASRVFNVPRETISIRMFEENNDGERTDSKIQEDYLQKIVISDIPEPVLGKNVISQIPKHDVQEDVISQIPEHDIQQDVISHISEPDRQTKVISDILPESNLQKDAISKNSGPDYKEISEIPENDLQRDIISDILQFNLQQDVILDKLIPNIIKNEIGQIQKSDLQNNEMSEEFDNEIYVKSEIPVPDYQQEIPNPEPTQVILETSELDPQNNAVSEIPEPNRDMYVIKDIPESDLQDVTSEIPVANLPVEVILEMHKANMQSILAASNASPIRGHWGSGYACCYCSQQFAEPSELKQHSFTHKNLLIIKVKSITDHIVKLDVTALKCNVCDSDMGSLEDLMVHLRDVHSFAIYSEIPNHILPFNFDSENLKCVKCQQEFESFKDLSDHMGDAHYRNYICVQCQRGFVNIRSLKTHSIQHGIGIFICSHCPNYFYSKEEVVEHENACHSKNDTMYYNVKHQTWAEGKVNICASNEANIVEEECNIVACNSSLQYKCMDCSKIFRSKPALNFHANLAHRRHKCNVCDSAFDIKFDLKRHMRKMHPSRSYQCPKCSQKCSSQMTLEEHMLKHEVVSEHCCELCCCRFTDENSYMVHMKNDHGLE